MMVTSETHLTPKLDSLPVAYLSEVPHPLGLIDLPSETPTPPLPLGDTSPNLGMIDQPSGIPSQPDTSQRDD